MPCPTSEAIFTPRIIVQLKSYSVLSLFIASLSWDARSLFYLWPQRVGWYSLGSPTTHCFHKVLPQKFKILNQLKTKQNA